jgi:broad specificity phosphatase PhoE
VAALFGLEVATYEPNEIDPETFLEQHKGQNVLIVGHSNTTPMLVNRFIGQERYEQVADTVNGNLYIVTQKGATIQSKVLSIENY